MVGWLVVRQKGWKEETDTDRWMDEWMGRWVGLVGAVDRQAELIYFKFETSW